LSTSIKADAALSAKLQEELHFEKDSQDAMAGREPEWLEEFNQNGTWSITDKTESSEVVLERKFGSEKWVANGPLERLIEAHSI
jgi:hypothetical protein